MTRITLTVATMLLGILILLISSISVWAEEINITLTAYTLVECHQNKGRTASGKMVREGHVAVSPDLEKKGLKLGTKIEIEDLGTFEVTDRTSRRLRGTIDIFMNSYRRALKFGRQKYVLILSESDEYLRDLNDEFLSDDYLVVN